MSNSFKVLCFGDVVGRPGRAALRELLPGLVKKYSADFVVVNGENASGGLGLSPDDADEFFSIGVSVITLGDHTWQNKQLHNYLDYNKQRCLRPGNYPAGAPGTGALAYSLPSGLKVGVMNLIGRVFFNFALDCPFKKADYYLEQELGDCKIVLCDMHAEATSEKYAMGRYLDGRVSLVYGTHTHVQTADDQIFKAGTGYLTDLGMCGASDSVIGMDNETAIDRLIGGIPRSYKIGSGLGMVNGLFTEIDAITGKALRLERIRQFVSS